MSFRPTLIAIALRQNIISCMSLPAPNPKCPLLKQLLPVVLQGVRTREEFGSAYQD